MIVDDIARQGAFDHVSSDMMTHHSGTEDLIYTS